MPSNGDPRYKCQPMVTLVTNASQWWPSLQMPANGDPRYKCHPMVTLVNVIHCRGVTIYWYIAIHEEFISYRNMKFVCQYIAIFLSSSCTVYFSFNSCLVAISNPEVYTCHIYTLIKGLHTVMCACIQFWFYYVRFKIKTYIEKLIGFYWKYIRKAIHCNTVKKIWQYVFLYCDTPNTLGVNNSSQPIGDHALHVYKEGKYSHLKAACWYVVVLF